MILDFGPGDKVINPSNKNWGIGQVQSIIKEKVTVNFENADWEINLKITFFKSHHTHDKQREYHHTLEKGLRRQIEQRQAQLLQDHQEQTELNNFINKKLNEIKT